MQTTYQQKGATMGVSLSKGGNVSLTKEAPGLTAIAVGLGWDVRTTTGADFDLDGQVQGRGVTRSPRDSSSGGQAVKAGVTSSFSLGSVVSASLSPRAAARTSSPR